MNPIFRAITPFFFALGLVLLNGCMKQGDQPAPSADGGLPATIQAVENSFVAHHYDQQLVQQRTQDGRPQPFLRWVPQWARAFERTSQRVAYLYVPLEPVFAAGPRAVHLAGFRKYLRVGQPNARPVFSIATYACADPKPTPTGGLPQTLSEDNLFLDAFTGTLLLKHLATGRGALIGFRRGDAVPAAKRPAAPPTAVTNTFGEPGCTNPTTCYWSAYCANYAITVGLQVPTDGGGSSSSCSYPSDRDNQYCSAPWQFEGSYDDAGCGGIDYGGGGGTGDPPPDGGGSNGSSAANSVLTIDTNNLKPCASSVLNSLKTLSGNPLLINLQKLAGSASGYNWTIKDGNLSSTNQTGFTAAGYDASTRSAITTFDSQKFPVATDLSFARTLLHESFHAYLVTYFANDRALANAEYSAMVDAYQIQHQDINDVHHVEMAFWVGNIADALQQYGQSKGYSLPTQFYQDMAWAGLEGTQAYQYLPNADKQRIQNTILTELTGMDSRGNSRPQSGRSPGC